jgi:HAMP domain-containing protein
MELAMERLQPLLLRSIERPPDDDLRSAMARRILEFQRQLQVQLDNVGSPAERRTTEALVRRFLNLQGAVRDMAGLRSRKERDQAHQARILPTVLSRVSLLMIGGLIVALGLAGYLCLRTARSILLPIRTLTRATGELARGNFDEPVRIETRDELAALASAFNTMARELEDYLPAPNFGTDHAPPSHPGSHARLIPGSHLRPRSVRGRRVAQPGGGGTGRRAGAAGPAA